jgi:5-bromo-4-chloroindolyl phosphate hydrolysis protein
MTTAESTQLELAKKDIKYMKSDLVEIKLDIKEIKNILIEQNEKFLTKKAIITWITVACSAIITAVAIANYYAK